MNLTQFLKTGLKATVAAGVFSFSALSLSANIDMSADANDLAIGGYDTVSYFTKGKPTQGSAKYTSAYKNTIYQFSSEENRNAFNENPAHYAPQYGGFCAMGVALEKKLVVDPTAWRIVDNKLYLNLNKAVQKKWLSDVDGHIETSEELWPEIKNKPAAELNEA
jgi:YHS domain-containing protein